jgi:GNAT superfamily N-acetyltransferase
MIQIENNKDKSFAIIREIAKTTWDATYTFILSKEQLDYMYVMMYSEAALNEQQFTKKHHFILAKENENYLGFASYELNCGKTNKTKVHKIYILPTAQGKGIGKRLLDYIASEAQKHQDKAVFLNVNRFNPAQDFYKRIGFSVSFEEVIDIGNGYVMDDYVMEKTI